MFSVELTFRIPTPARDTNELMAFCERLIAADIEGQLMQQSGGELVKVVGMEVTENEESEDRTFKPDPQQFSI
jgi:hypothetical protein